MAFPCVLGSRALTKIRWIDGIPGHGLYMDDCPRFTTFASMPVPLMFLPISSTMRTSRSQGSLGIQFCEGQVLLVALFQTPGRHSIELRRVVVRVFDDREPSNHLP
jgi:hypothetical protein